MDRITFERNDAVLDANFAAESILTGNFVASVVNADEETVRAAFTEPGVIYVRSMDTTIPDSEYPGYRSVQSIEEQPDGLTVIVTKEAPGNG